MEQGILSREQGIHFLDQGIAQWFGRRFNARARIPLHKFDFLGYTFRPRKSKNRQGEYFVSFSPAVSDKAATAIRRTMRLWALHQRSDKSPEDLAGIVNPALRGWINYYGRFHRNTQRSIPCTGKAAR